MHDLWSLLLNQYIIECLLIQTFVMIKSWNISNQQKVSQESILSHKSSLLRGAFEGGYGWGN